MKIALRLASESFAFAWQALVNNKLRTMLSLLGVAIGIFSIIFVLSVVDSMEADMKKSLDMIGSNILFVQKWPMAPENGAQTYEWWKYMRRREPSVADMEMLADRLNSLAAYAFQNGGNKTVEYENNFFESADVIGITYQYRETVAMNIAAGRYFSELECHSGKNFAIIGNELSEQLFGYESPIGKKIKVGGLSVTVIGRLKKEGASLFGGGLDTGIILPVNFTSRLFDESESNGKIILKAKDGISNKELRDEVVAAFREVRRVRPHDDNDFSVIESSMITGIVENIIGVFNNAGMIIGVFAILVGAFSIANIMFVSVKERTHIIGIQKSLGAKNHFVLLQFLFESIALSLIGGFFGLLLVWLMTIILGSFSDFDFSLPGFRIAMGMGIAVSVGIVSGIIPALSASRLNPVEAMRAK
ncbi:MAG: ABC transporter permease [Crocinitomicaceae bacterium]|nr:ABC transporter permease [Crocinitomicaceae bacterium]